jgi:hypothetical protein
MEGRLMTYEPGDLVSPADLPRRLLCRVISAQSIGTGGGTRQLLRLEPLEGQDWHPGVTLIRRGDLVLPARLGDLWRAGVASRRAALHHGSRPRGGCAPDRMRP